MREIVVGKLCFYAVYPTLPDRAVGIILLLGGKHNWNLQADLYWFWLGVGWGERPLEPEP
jgi:hypothetical protein